MAETESKAEEVEDKIGVKTFAIGSVALTVFFLLYWFAVTSGIQMANDQGLFGDMFGGLNAIFSGLAFVGLIATLLQGQKELKLQRREITLQREAIEKQKDELKRSAEAQELSRIALTLSSLLDTHERLESFDFFENQYGVEIAQHTRSDIEDRVWPLLQALKKI